MSCCGKSDKPSGSGGSGKGLQIRKDEGKVAEYKVVLLGDAGVGKSSISQRYCYNLFADTYAVTIGGAYLNKTVTLKNGTSVKLHLWDTGGEERFRSMAPLYYRDASAAILVYDVQDAKTFKNLEYWIKELEGKVKQDKLILALAGNKADVEPKAITTQSAKVFAETSRMIFYETSAKTGAGIDELFQQLAESLGTRPPGH
jgi:small GTP-binding protein